MCKDNMLTAIYFKVNQNCPICKKILKTISKN